MMDLIPLHSEVVQDHPDIRAQCASILNTEWPRSENMRLRSLETSCSDLPMSLALVQWFPSEHGRRTPFVVGTSRLASVLGESDAVWIESVIIHPDLRGKGFGKYLMLLTEDFSLQQLGRRKAYLCTVDQQVFYSKIGYKLCPPVCAYSGNSKLAATLVRQCGINKIEPAVSEVSPSSANPPKANSTSEPQTKSTASMPPPPPPPPSSSRCKPDNSIIPESLVEECLKSFRVLRLTDVPAPSLEVPPKILSITKEASEKRSGCCMSNRKDYMSKELTHS